MIINDNNNQGYVNAPFGVDNNQRNNSYFNNMGLNNFGNYMNRPMGNSPLPNIYSQQSNQFLKCRPVSSREEAIAAQIDLDGSLWVFINLNNEQIYTKKVLPDGTSQFKSYIHKEEPPPSETTEYVTKKEFNQVIKELMAVIQTPNQNTNQQIDKTDKNSTAVPSKF